MATCIAVGNVSLLDCPRFTWSFGCTGDLEPSSPPASSIARFEITSLAFMLVCVPEPVCHTTRGKWSSSSPATTSRAASTISDAMSRSSVPRSPLATAAACLTRPNASMIERPHTNRSRPIGKLPMLRCVCAPQYREASTSISPMESVSTRVLTPRCWLSHRRPATSTPSRRHRVWRGTHRGRPGTAHA